MKRFGTLLIILLSLVSAFHGCSKGDDSPRSKSVWIERYFAEITSGRYPYIHAISWWHEDFDHTRLTINSSSESLETYRKMVSNDIFITGCLFENGGLVPVPERIYHSAFPGFGGTEDVVSAGKIEDFEQLAQKEIAWAYFSNNWMDSLIFPKEAVEVIAGAGSVPFIRLMFRSVFVENQADPKYQMLDIVSGKYDRTIKAWANEAKSCRSSLLVEFGTEVNGRWFPWNGSYYGGGTTGRYGDPGYPDGPEIFRDAYRHIIELCNQEGCSNITWFFHFDVNDDPEEWWNAPVYYYPGDDYINWIGVSTYGPQQKGEDYVNPEELIRKAYRKMKEVSLNKPYAILEFGVTEL